MCSLTIRSSFLQITRLIPSFDRSGNRNLEHSGDLATVRELERGQTWQSLRLLISIILLYFFFFFNSETLLSVSPPCLCWKVFPADRHELDSQRPSGSYHDIATASASAQTLMSTSRVPKRSGTRRLCQEAASPQNLFSRGEELLTKCSAVQNYSLYLIRRRCPCKCFLP